MVLERVIETKDLEPYFKIAAQAALQSECERRKYGAVIAFNGNELNYAAGYNKRVSKGCNGICARNHFELTNGERAEVGAEIHAETAALISGGPKLENSAFVLVGFLPDGKELLGKSVYPCHTCALNIKFAGFNHIYIRNENTDIVAVSIAEIIESREEEWTTTD